MDAAVRRLATGLPDGIRKRRGDARPGSLRRPRSGRIEAATRRCAMSDGQQRLETIFRAESGRLFGIAYRMLGSVSEAEEVVQDAFVRYQGVDPAEVREPGALLTTI